MPSEYTNPCQGMARFDRLDQAEYVADQEELVDGGTWKVIECGDHYHVMEV